MTGSVSLPPYHVVHPSGLAPQGFPSPQVQPRLPASARRVHAALRDRGPQTHRDLVASTGLPARTLRYAVARLRDAGLVEGRAHLADCRQTLFYLPETGPTGQSSPRYRFL